MKNFTIIILLSVCASCHAKKEETRPKRTGVEALQLRPIVAHPATHVDELDVGRPLPRVASNREPSLPRRSILDRPNDYGSGAGVPVAPETQDVRKRLDSSGRYAAPQPSQRTFENR